MFPHDVDQIVFHTPRHIKIMEGLSCDFLYSFPIFFLFISNNNIFFHKAVPPFTL